MAATNIQLPGSYQTGEGDWLKAFGQAYNQQGSVFDSSQMKQIQSWLMPQSGGLSSNLQQMLQLGQGQINQQTGQQVASARTSALGRGLEGSTMEAAEVSGANAAGQNAQSSLLSSILGMQSSQTSQLAQMLMQGLGMDQNQVNQLLQMLQGGAENASNYSMFQQSLQQAKDLAKQQSGDNLLASLFGLGGQLGGGVLQGLFS